VTRIKRLARAPRNAIYFATFSDCHEGRARAPRNAIHLHLNLFAPQRPKQAFACPRTTPNQGYDLHRVAIRQPPFGVPGLRHDFLVDFDGNAAAVVAEPVEELRHRQGSGQAFSFAVDGQVQHRFKPRCP